MRKSFCRIEGCGELKRYAASGLCGKHEHRRRRGIPMNAPHYLEGLSFEKHFTQTDGCWEWQGYCDKNGYGRFRQSWAHRVSYERYVGPIPTGLQIDHLCRNHPCVNPAHLEAVTREENNRRAALFSHVRRRPPLSEACPRGHEWTAENTYLRPDNGNRQCRECRRVRLARKAAERAGSAA